MAEWARVAATTIPKHIRKVEDAVIRNRKLLAALRKKGRISFNNHGSKFDWRTEFRRNALIQYADMQEIEFARNQRWQVPELDYRAYVVSDGFTEREITLNGGVEGIVKLQDGVMKGIQTDLEEQFQEQLYVDGNAVGYENAIHGYASWTAGTYTTGKVFAPTDTYAGLSCALGNYGGSWAPLHSSTAGAGWPDGTGDVTYDFWSPIIINTQAVTSNGGFTTTATWLANCVDALRYGIQMGYRNSNLDGKLDLVLMNRNMYLELLSTYEGDQRLVVERNARDGLMWSLGFTDTIMFDGCEVTSEFGIPASSATDTRQAFGFNLNKFELMSSYDVLFKSRGPDFDIRRLYWRVLVEFLGNLKIASPRYAVNWRSA